MSKKRSVEAGSVALTRDFKATAKARLQAEPKFRSALLKAVHETAVGLNEAGAMDPATRRAFDQLCKLPSKKRRREAGLLP